MHIDVIKCQGSGNDFPLVDARALTLDDASWARIAVALADRNGSVGGDGLLLLTAGDALHAMGFRMFNSDGSEAETCLNGVRCVARLGFEALGIERAAMRLQTSTVEVWRDPDLAPGVATIREVAGPVNLDVTQWPMTVGADRMVGAPGPAPGGARGSTAVALATPPPGSFVDSVDEAELVALGERCEAAPAWLPNRANVSFVELRGEDALFVRTFERGVGLTDSCGSAMAASTYAACLTGRRAVDSGITVFNRGGLIRAQAGADGMVRLSGNATFEWVGSVEIDLATRTAGPVSVTRRHDDEVAAWRGVIAAIA